MKKCKKNGKPGCEMKCAKKAAEKAAKKAAKKAAVKATKKAAKKTCPLCKLVKGVLKFLGIATGVLFIVYFWNLDQKLLGWAYKNVNKIFDRKPTDIKF